LGIVQRHSTRGHGLLHRPRLAAESAEWLQLIAQDRKPLVAEQRQSLASRFILYD
jgi:hypothetical protein